MTYTRGKYAQAVCDICGLWCDYLELKDTYNDSHPTGFKACNDCFDPDHPQNRVGDVPVNDAISLEEPRTDTPRADYTEGTFTPALSTLFLDQ